MSKPVDDVYLTWLYKRPCYPLEQAVGMLKRFQQLDFTHPKQFVYINVFLDMALQKKVGWQRVWEFWHFSGFVTGYSPSPPWLLFFFFFFIFRALQFPVIV